MKKVLSIALMLALFTASGCGRDGAAEELALIKDKLVLTKDFLSRADAALQSNTLREEMAKLTDALRRLESRVRDSAPATAEIDRAREDLQAALADLDRFIMRNSSWFEDSNMKKILDDLAGARGDIGM